MRRRFAVMLGLAVVSVGLFLLPMVPWSSISAMFISSVPFLLSRPLPNRKILFRRGELDEREVQYLRRIDSVAITVFFGAFIAWLILGFTLSSIEWTGQSVVSIHMISVALQTIPGFVLIHSIVGLTLFGRDQRPAVQRTKRQTAGGTN